MSPCGFATLGTDNPVGISVGTNGIDIAAFGFLV
jgi:hypothetical protein